jgi:hypothetical protein
MCYLQQFETPIQKCTSIAPLELEFLRRRFATHSDAPLLQVLIVVATIPRVRANAFVNATHSMRQEQRSSRGGHVAPQLMLGGALD